VKPHLLLLVSPFLVGSSLQRTATAQSSIMNVPSTDVVATKNIYLEMDFSSNHVWQRDENRFHNYVARAVVGLGHNLEAGVNLSYTRVPGGGEPVEVQPNIKWQFYRSEERETAAAVGCILFTPVTNWSGTNTLGQCYLVGSKKLKGRLAPRFTGGIYVLVNARDDERTEIGALVGYEQPLSKKISFIVDWSSGDNRLGYVSLAFYFATSSNGGLSIGYTIANHGKGNNAPFAYYGIQF